QCSYGKTMAGYQNANLIVAAAADRALRQLEAPFTIRVVCSCLQGY
ncbi:hypothetical protein Tco_0632239, partial [Tanacetum coccineum]